MKKVYGVLPAGWRGEDRITTGQFAPRLGATLADWAEPSRRIIHATHAAAPEAIDLQLQGGERSARSSPSRATSFAGIRLPPGGDARRRLANLPSDDVDKLRRLATRRRQMRMLIERSQGNAAWAAQVSHLTDDLDPASAGELLFELAEGYRAAGKLDLAADTYSLARAPAAGSSARGAGAAVARAILCERRSGPAARRPATRRTIDRRRGCER